MFYFAGPDSPTSPVKDLSPHTRALKLKHQSLEDRLELCLLELRKLCIREAVSWSSRNCSDDEYYDNLIRLFESTFGFFVTKCCVFPSRSWQANCPQSILWRQRRSLHESEGGLELHLSWMKVWCKRISRYGCLHFTVHEEVSYPHTKYKVVFLSQDSELQALETDLALQQQIYVAARKLSLEDNLSKPQKKSRLLQCKREERKVKDLQEAVFQHRIKSECNSPCVSTSSSQNKG